MKVDWRQLAVQSAKDHGSADPVRSAELILRALPPVRLIDDTCQAMDCGVPPPEGEGASCVDYDKHLARFEGEAQKALDAYRQKDIQDRLDKTWPCDAVLDKAKETFLKRIDDLWGIFEPGGLVDDIGYIQDNLPRVPPRIQEKWKNEFIAIFGRDKTLAQFTPAEASWVRHKLAGFCASTQKGTRKAAGQPQRAKR